jgi:DNA gyrase/topoisomerase IV subunit B
MKQNKVVLLSDIEHALKRSARYLGAIVSVSVLRYYLKDNKIVYGTIEYVPALLKIIREIIDNSLDEAIRTNYKFANKIKITISKDTVIIEDNGRGIPVIHGEDSSGNKLDELMPTLAWCNLKAGSNFDDEADNETAGQNGEGSSLCNIWSKSFIGETSDGNLYYKVHCKDNLSSKEITTKPSKKKFTKVTFKPDLDKMGIEEISDLYKDLIEFDLMFLRETFPKINFTFERK